MPAETEWTKNKVTKQMPTKLDVREIMPSGKEPYIECLAALGGNHIDRVQSLEDLHMAHSDGSLRPRLSSELGELVGRACEVIETHLSDEVDSGTTASIIAMAVYEGLISPIAGS